MNSIEKLIEELCPEGVRHLQLGEIGSFEKGAGLTRAEITEDGQPCVHYGDIHVKYGISITETATQTSDKIFSKLRKVNYGDLIIADASEDIGGVAKATTWLGAGEVGVGGHTLVFRHKQNPMFLAHFFTTLSFQIQKNRYVKGTSVKDIASKSISKVQVPIPPLDIQNEIVKILDKFTQLEAELEAELEARKKQYEALRSMYLDFDRESNVNPLSEKIRELCPEGVETHKLSSICSKVQSVSWSKQSGKTFEYIDLSSVDIQTGRLGETKRIDESNAPSRARQIADKNDVLFATTRPTQMRLHLVAESSKYIASTGYSVIRVSEKRIDPKFIYFYLGTKGFFRYVENNQALGNYPSISDSTVKEFGIRLPPLVIQKEIVRILEDLDLLVNSVRGGIPAEIAARKKQYDYYRDKLLTFKELKSA